MTSSVSRPLRRGAIVSVDASSLLLVQRADFTTANWATDLIHIYAVRRPIFTGVHFQTDLQTSSSSRSGRLVFLAVCSLLYKLWRAARTNNSLVINHCWFHVKSFGNGGWHWLQLWRRHRRGSPSRLLHDHSATVWRVCGSPRRTNEPASSEQSQPPEAWWPRAWSKWC